MSETVTQVSETEQKIVRSRTCGCRDFYIAKLTQNDAKAYVAEYPVSIPMREQKSNLRSMHLHHRTDRFFSVSYTRTVFL